VLQEKEFLGHHLKKKKIELEKMIQGMVFFTHSWLERKRK
jgi:hypothetical protein